MTQSGPLAGATPFIPERAMMSSVGGDASRVFTRATVTTYYTVATDAIIYLGVQATIF